MARLVTLSLLVVVPFAAAVWTEERIDTAVNWPGFPIWTSRMGTMLHPRRRLRPLFRRAPFTALKTAVVTRSN